MAKKKETAKNKDKEETKDEAMGDPKDIEKNKGVALLSYILFLFLIPMFLKRKSHFCQFHAKQGLVLFIAGIIAFFLQLIPIIGTLAIILVFFLSVVGIYKCIEGEYWKVPYLHQFAEKLNI